ncbi:hypothetical protein ACJX0J_028184, partial [Zea mays]
IPTYMFSCRFCCKFIEDTFNIALIEVVVVSNSTFIGMLQSARNCALAPSGTPDYGISILFGDFHNGPCVGLLFAFLYTWYFVVEFLGCNNYFCTKSTHQIITQVNIIMEYSKYIKYTDQILGAALLEQENLKEFKLKLEQENFKLEQVRKREG